MFCRNFFQCLCEIQTTDERFLQFFNYYLWALANSSNIPFLYATLSILSPDTSVCGLNSLENDEECGVVVTAAFSVGHKESVNLTPSEFDADSYNIAIKIIDGCKMSI